MQADIEKDKSINGAFDQVVLAVAELQVRESGRPTAVHSGPDARMCFVGQQRSRQGACSTEWSFRAVAKLAVGVDHCSGIWA